MPHEIHVDSGVGLGGVIQFGVQWYVADRLSDLFPNVLSESVIDRAVAGIHESHTSVARDG